MEAPRGRLSASLMISNLSKDDCVGSTDVFSTVEQSVEVLSIETGGTNARQGGSSRVNDTAARTGRERGNVMVVCFCFGGGGKGNLRGAL